MLSKSDKPAEKDPMHCLKVAEKKTVNGNDGVYQNLQDEFQDNLVGFLAGRNVGTTSNAFCDISAKTWAVNIDGYQDSENAVESRCKTGPQVQWVAGVTINKKEPECEDFKNRLQSGKLSETKDRMNLQNWVTTQSPSQSSMTSSRRKSASDKHSQKGGGSDYIQQQPSSSNNDHDSGGRSKKNDTQDSSAQTRSGGRCSGEKPKAENDNDLGYDAHGRNLGQKEALEWSSSLRDKAQNAADAIKGAIEQPDAAQVMQEAIAKCGSPTPSLCNACVMEHYFNNQKRDNTLHATNTFLSFGWGGEGDTNTGCALKERGELWNDVVKSWLSEEARDVHKENARDWPGCWAHGAQIRDKEVKKAGCGFAEVLGAGENSCGIFTCSYDNQPRAIPYEEDNYREYEVKKMGLHERPSGDCCLNAMVNNTADNPYWPKGNNAMAGCCSSEENLSKVFDTCKAEQNKAK